jgi:hypothetical protein
MAFSQINGKCAFWHLAGRSYSGCSQADRQTFGCVKYIAKFIENML